MNLIRYNQEPLTVEINDMIPGIKRKAAFKRFEMTEDIVMPESGEDSPRRGNFTIYMTIQHFMATGENGYGEPCTSRAIQNYDFSISAYGNDIVDASTGAFLKEAASITIEDIEEGGILHDKAVMYDNEFLRQVAYNAPINVMSTIVQFIQEHAARGKFPN